jgi:ribosome-associated translation inhibitor RaiA
MIIQYNTDKTINGDERHQDFFNSQIADEFKIYEPHITRIEVHLSSKNGKKDGLNDIECILETRLKGMKPIAVSNQADSIKFAVSGAIDKLKASLETIIGKLQNH